MRAPSPLPPPSPPTLRKAAASLLSTFNPDTFAFPDPEGAWQENPSTFYERCLHEIVYRAWRLRKEPRTHWLDGLAEEAAAPAVWTRLKRLNSQLPPQSVIEPAAETIESIDTLILSAYGSRHDFQHLYPAFLIFNALAWKLACEALRSSLGVFIPNWDIKGQKRKRSFLSRLESLEALDGQSDKNEAPFLTDFLNALSEDPSISLPKLLGEEDRLNQEIRRIRENAENSGDEEAHSILLDKIHPSMGIVTLASPAFLYPCSRLLVDSFWPVSSGIPYKAAVMLSVFSERRSTASLLEAMTLYSPRVTKIRENLIYTLGRIQVEGAAGRIAEVLEGPDEILSENPGGPAISHLLIDQKAEAIRALGNLRIAALPALSSIVRCQDHASALLRTNAAWALGDIGKAQKETSGGISADILITLLQLLKSPDKTVFEQAVSSLKKIDMPDFIHSLYLYHAGAVSILGLKPAQKGLYELSETLHHLLKTRKQVVIAVNGDSGTGKTYFCQSLAEGFSTLKSKEILYLMRDRKRDQKIFNRMLGLKWLKTHIDPDYYHDYPVSENEDDPEAFFSGFLHENTDKKLIILDGCRDRNYFQRVIDLFYFHGTLDVVVNFRATYSTRRQNLEEREIALESLKTHLSFLEEPALEDTHYYQEGLLTLFDLDNSRDSRLDRQETLELFRRGRINSWGDLIRIGKFSRPSIPLEITDISLEGNEKSFHHEEGTFFSREGRDFQPEERRFRSRLNEDPTSHPHLIQTIDTDDLKPKHLRFYAQDQIAGLGGHGAVFVLTFLDNHIFHTHIRNAVDMVLLGRDFFLITPGGELIRVSFERNETQQIARTSSPPTSLVSFPREKVITGHADGTLRIWDISRRTVSVLQGHTHPISALSVDYSGRITSCSRDSSLKRWDLENNRMVSFPPSGRAFYLLRHFPPGKAVALCAPDSESLHPLRHSEIHLIEFASTGLKTQALRLDNTVSGFHITADGRLLTALKTSSSDSASSENLAVITWDKKKPSIQFLRGHSRETYDCLPLGPKIVSCGRENDGTHSLRVWGTESFVKRELNRISLRQPPW